LYNLYVVDLKHIPPMVYNSNNSADVEVRLRRKGSQPAIHIYCLIMSDTECVVSGTSGEIRLEKL